MRKVIVGARVSMDGVMQAPSGPDADPTTFKFGGWAWPYGNEELFEELDRLFSEQFDLLLGRKTYEIFAGYWPYQVWEDAPNGGMPKVFNEIKKYVVSRSGEVDTSWTGTLLLRDIDAVRRLRQEDGPNLVTQGSTELVHALLTNDLVDAMSIFTVPVVLGGGKKLFADGSAPHAYKLTRSRVTSMGVLIGHYERDGEVKTGDGSALNTAEAEAQAARQNRMQREG